MIELLQKTLHHIKLLGTGEAASRSTQPEGSPAIACSGNWLSTCQRSIVRHATEEEKQAKQNQQNTRLLITWKFWVYTADRDETNPDRKSGKSRVAGK